MNILKKIFCKHKEENVSEYKKLMYGYKALFICKKCGRKRISVC